MSALRSRNGCNCPRQPKSLKEIKWKMGKLNYSDEWAFSKIPEYPSISKEIEADKHAYEVCCGNRKNRTKAPRRKNLIPSQPEELRKSKPSLGEANERLCKIYNCPLARSSFPTKKQPKWRQELEHSLEKEAKAEEEKNLLARFQSEVKKLEAQERFQRLLEQNQSRSIRWRLEKQEKLKNQEKNLYGKEKTKEEKKEKPTPELVEKELMKVFRKVGRIVRDRKKVGTESPEEVLNIPLGTYEKRHSFRDDERFREFVTDLYLTEKNVKKRKAEKSPALSAWDLQNLRQDGSFAFVNKTVPLPYALDQMAEATAVKVPQFYSLRENPNLTVDIKRNKTTNVGAKFSWNFRKLVKAKDVLKPKMSKPFNKLVTGKHVQIPELLPSLKSRDKILEERKKEAKPLPHKSRREVDSEPNYGVSKTGRSLHMPIGEIKPKFTEHFNKMLKGKEENIPELNEILKSHHDILPDLKRAGKSSSGQRKFKQNAESNPNYGVSKTNKSNHLPFGKIEPKFSKQFHKTFRGKEATMPELKGALMSHHEIFPDVNRAGKSSSGLPKGKLRHKFDSTYRVSKTDTSAEKHGYENVSLRSILKSTAPYHQTQHDKDKRGLSLPSKDKKVRRSTMSHIGKKLERFKYYIRDSEADQRIMEQRDSKNAISYLNRKSITSLTSTKSGPIRYSETSEMAGQSGQQKATDPTQCFMDVTEKEQTSKVCKDDIMFDTVPEDYQPPINQDTVLKKTLSELIGSIVESHIAKKTSKSKNALMPKVCPADSEQNVHRNSSVSLKSVHDEIKQFEQQALKEYAVLEQYQEFVVVEKAAVQARIQELMKYVVIREDFKPPKPPRDFITENIEMLQKMRPRKIGETKKKWKPNQKYPKTKKQQMPGFSDFSECPFRNGDHEETTKKRCFSSQDQQEQAKPKAPAEVVVREAQKCDTLDVGTCEY
ncbi:hypothetical protein KR038_006692 [Drosophila bunnanda]|nr:hypothetical protein KR038_006692 [Drosophila bunnanda]